MIRTLDWRLRQLHKEEAGYCFGCGAQWPCATEQLVAEYLAERKREQQIQTVEIHHMDIVWGADEEPAGRDGEIIYQSSVTHIPTRCSATGTGRSVLAARESAIRGLREAIAATRILPDEVVAEANRAATESAKRGCHFHDEFTEGCHGCARWREADERLRRSQAVYGTPE